MAIRNVMANDIGDLQRAFDEWDGSRIIVPRGTYEGKLRLPSGLAGTLNRPIKVEWLDATILQTSKTDSAFVLSGQGEPLYLSMQGDLTLEGGQNNFYGSRSNVIFSSDFRLLCTGAAEDAIKWVFHNVAKPAWGCVGVFFYGGVIVDNFGQEGVDMGAWEYAFQNLIARRPNDPADGRRNVCAFRDKGSGKINGIVNLLVEGGEYAFSAASLGGICDYSTPDRFECENVTMDVTFRGVKVSNGQLLAIQAARSCNVTARVEGVCEAKNQYRIIQEAAGSGFQMNSRGIVINGNHEEPVTHVQGDFPDLPVEQPVPDPVEPTIEERLVALEQLPLDIGTLSAQCEAQRQLLAAHKDRLDALEQPHGHAIIFGVATTTGSNKPVGGGE